MPILVNESFVALEDDPTQKPRATVSMDVQGPDTAEYRLTETNQSDPVGRFRFRVIDRELRIERATAANWASSETMITVSADGVTFVTPSDNQLDALQALLLEVTLLGEVVELLAS